MELPIIVLSGPTASGKTAMSLELAKEFNGEVVAVDSMTVYKGMDIGTDKPTKVQSSELKVQKLESGLFEINGVTHHLIDIVEPSEEMNAALLKECIKKAVKKIHASGKIPFLVGGSALYLDTYLYDYQMPEVKPDPKFRKELEPKSCEELFAELIELDPDCEWTIDRNNKRRIIRALEVVKKTGKSFCDQKSKNPLPSNVLYLAIQKDREGLYQKINKRVDEMMAEGFLDEVKELYKKFDHNTAMQAAGYKQMVEHLDGNLTLVQAVEKTKQIHRNFAKRQMTWFLKNKDIRWVKNLAQAEVKIKDFLGKKEYNF